MHTEVILAVKDVRRSAAWYEQLLGCRSSHGGSVFEILRNGQEEIMLCLHHWGDHGHPTLTDPGIAAGNGMILYFKVENLSDIWRRAQMLDAVIEEEPHLNSNSGLEEFSLRDPDGYYISISY
ncbi:VOC family protein [Taibaiella koreensis]|uniref:VOC family protein n=1 Tax=Taibaiella koreensis TaxID=1268548 RepID=UPI000E599CC7|nr:VOC family protein [Taibaiella koreensis]